MKKLEIFSLHPVVSWQPPNPQNYNYFRFGAILLCIAKFLFFFLSGQIIFCSLMTNYNFTRRNFAYMTGESGLGLSGWIKPEQYHFNRSSASVLSRNCRKLKGEKKNGLEIGGIRTFFTKDKKNDMTDYYQWSFGKILSSFRSTVDKTLKIVCTNFLWC